MSLLDLIKKEDDRYISVNDFIKLIANNTKDTSDVVIEYLGKFCLSDYYNVSVYIKGFGNEYSKEFHLSDLIFKDDKKDDFRFYTMSELKKDDEFLTSYLLKDEVFNIKYIKDLNLKTDNDKSQATNSHKIKTPTSTVELGEYQKLLISYELFTPEQIVCLMIDENPASISHNDKYLAHSDRVSTALDANALTPINDKNQIASAQVEAWLARCGLIYKGFNDYVIEEDDPLQKSIDDTTEILSIVYEDNERKDREIKQIAAEYKELRLENKELEQRLADKETNASFMMGNPTVEQRDPKDSVQIISDLRDQVTQLTNDNASLKNQLTQQAEAPADDNTLQTILDESHDEHAPDLKHAIQLWIDLYIHGGIKGDSHSSKANIWIRNNTHYAENANSSIGRIREIATPLKDFGAKRSREEEK